MEMRTSRIRKKVAKKKKTIMLRITVVTMLSSIILLNGCELNKETATPVAPKKVENTAKAEAVKVQQDMTIGGQTEPFQVFFLAPSISGNVREISVDIGAYVKKDQVLAKIDESDLAYQIKQAEANVKQVQVEAQMRAIEQQINLNEMKVKLSTETTEEAEEQKFLIRSLEMDLADAKKNADRTNTLYSQGALSQEQMEQAQTQKTQAENELAKAKKLIEIKGAREAGQRQTALSVAKLEKQSAQASAQLTKMGVEQAKANLELIRYQYNNLTVKAPISGFITDIRGIMGQAVTPADTLFVITNQDKLYVRGDVPEALINRIKVGQQATINILTMGKSVEGKVIYVAPLADPKTQAFPIRVLVDNADHGIKGGMRTKVSIKE